MAAYLSPGWFDDVNRAAGADDELAGAIAGASVTIQQVVTDGPAGEVRYWVRLQDGRFEACPGQADGPDATVTQSYDTAVEVSLGRLEVEAAILAGRIRLAGDVSALVRHHAALQQVARSFGEVRRHTTYAGSSA